MSLRLRFAVVFIASLAYIAIAQAQTTWHVDDDNCPGPGSGTEPDPFCKIQDGIDTATDGDEVLVAMGTYHETIDFNGKAITLRSSDGPEVTTISAAGLNRRVVTAGNGEGADTVFEGFTVRDGFSQSGGGMGIFAASPTVKNCIFTGNISDHGGGMGIQSASSQPLIQDCIFTGNVAENGGGINTCCGAAPTISRCTFSENFATGQGGGGMRNRESSPVVVECIFSKNSVFNFGGGMNNHVSSPSVSNCTFVGNRASLGGGIINSAGSPVITGCVFSENCASGGAGMTVLDGITIASHSTFSGNKSSPGGGGTIFITSENTLVLSNSIVWNDPIASIVSQFDQTISYSDIEGGWEGEGNIDLDPLFTDPENGDFHLSSTSPCIDSGDPNSVPEPDETDLDGEARMFNNRVDMGADEFHDCDGNSIPDHVDCDDGNSCTADACVAGSCEHTFAECGLADGCCGPDCDPDIDPDCCLPSGEACTNDDNCCSNKCKNGTCRGNPQ